MISCFKELACQREQLVACCAAQRKAFTGEAHALKEKLLVFDIGLTLLGRFKKKSAWITGLIVGVVVFKPRRLMSLLPIFLLARQTLQAIIPMLKKSSVEK